MAQSDWDEINRTEIAGHARRIAEIVKDRPSIVLRDFFAMSAAVRARRCFRLARATEHVISFPCEHEA